MNKMISLEKNRTKLRRNHLNEHFTITTPTTPKPPPKSPAKPSATKSAKNKSDVVSSPAKATAVNTSSSSSSTSPVPRTVMRVHRGSLMAFRPRRAWSLAEIDAFKLGIAKYGIGNWSMMVDDPALQFDRRSASDLKDKHRNVKAARYGSHVTNNIFKVGFKILSIVDMSHQLVEDQWVTLFSIMTNLHSEPIAWVAEQSQHPDWLPALKAFRHKGGLSAENAQVVDRLLKVFRPSWTMKPIFIRHATPYTGPSMEPKVSSARSPSRDKAIAKKRVTATKSPTPRKSAAAAAAAAAALAKAKSAISDDVDSSVIPAKRASLKRIHDDDDDEDDIDLTDMFESAPRPPGQRAKRVDADRVVEAAFTVSVQQSKLQAREQLLREQELARQKLEQEREDQERLLLASKQEALAAAQADLDRFNEMRMRHKQMSEAARQQIESESSSRKRDRAVAADASFIKSPRKSHGASVRFSDVEDDEADIGVDIAIEERAEKLPKRSSSKALSNEDFYDQATDLSRMDDRMAAAVGRSSPGRISQSQGLPMPFAGEPAESSPADARISQSQPLHSASSLVDGRSLYTSPNVPARKSPVSPRRVVFGVEDSTSHQQVELAKKRDKILQLVRRSRELARSDPDVANLSQSESQCSLM